MANRPQNANLRRGGPGRPKGVPNKANQDIRDAARKLLEDEEYQRSLALRLKRGDAPHMETLLHHYGYGKPKETLEVSTPMRPLIVDRITAADLALPDPDDDTRD